MEKEEKNVEKNETICDFGAAKGESDIFCLSIIGEIEGHGVLDSSRKTTKYEHVIPMLAAVEENPDIHGLLLLINTVGGDVESGLAIAEMIATDGPFLLETCVVEEGKVLPMTPPGGTVNQMLLDC